MSDDHVHLVKERPDAVWCGGCSRRPTWSATGTCYRCRHGLEPRGPALLLMRSRADPFADFARTDSWPAVARFALVVIAAELVVNLPILVFGSSAGGGSTGGAIGLYLLLVGTGTLSAGAGFLFVLRLSEPFYLPLGPALRRAAMLSGVLAAIVTSFGCCIPAGGGLHMARDVVLPLLAASVVSAFVLEAARDRALKSITQRDSCLSCGHLLIGMRHERCPECGGPILRARATFPIPEDTTRDV